MSLGMPHANIDDDKQMVHNGLAQDSQGQEYRMDLGQEEREVQGGQEEVVWLVHEQEHELEPEAGPYGGHVNMMNAGIMAAGLAGTAFGAEASMEVLQEAQEAVCSFHAFETCKLF